MWGSSQFADEIEDQGHHTIYRTNKDRKSNNSKEEGRPVAVVYTTE